MFPTASLHAALLALATLAASLATISFPNGHFRLVGYYNIPKENNLF